jgi:NADH:ubiquinone oxidoreductase subunit 6 (subunit J)
MAGFVIAVVAAALPFALGTFGLGRTRIVVGVGAVLAFGWLVAAAAQRDPRAEEPPLWFLAGLVLLLYAIWCGGLWLGVRVRRMRQATPG